MITYLSNRHSKEKEEVPGNMWDMPELSIVQQIAFHDGLSNKYSDKYGYLIYGGSALYVCSINQLAGQMGSYLLTSFISNLFKESAPGTVLSLTQE